MKKWSLGKRLNIEIPVTCLMLACVLSIGLVQADEVDIVGSLSEEETRKVGAFARQVGQSYVCAPEGERAEMRQDIRLIFNFITQDMGTDAAFLYAVGVGYGGRKDKASLDCDSLLKKWAETRYKFGLIGEGQ